MSSTVQKDSKEQILAAFSKLLAAKKQNDSKVATKEEEAEKEKNQELLSTVAEYTVDNIVNGIATLQLDFGSTLTELSERLAGESGKLEELQRSIAIENQNLEELQRIRLVADALYLLRQENQEKTRILNENAAQNREILEKEQTQTRKQWQKDREAFDRNVAEAETVRSAVREREETDFSYELQRDRQLAADRYEATQRQQERELQEIGRDKEKDWTEREAFLAENQAKFEENQQKVAGYEEELKQAYTKAKEEAIKDAEREAKVKENLFNKEWEAAEQGYELQIQSLQQTIERQSMQIADLTSQLQAVMQQAQELAMKAFQSGDGPSQN